MIDFRSAAASAALLLLPLLASCGARAAAPTPARALAEAILRELPAKPGTALQPAAADRSDELLRRIPERWEETRAVGTANPKISATARRYREEWFVGVTGAEGRQTGAVRLEFLESGRAYIVHRFLDHPSGSAPGTVYGAEKVVAEQTLQIVLRSGGGAAFWITPDVKRR